MCPYIEPVRERRRARPPKTQRVEMRVERVAALRPAVHGKARRLVDHQYQPVAVEQAGEHLFRRHDALPRYVETAITGAA